VRTAGLGARAARIPDRAAATQGLLA